MCGSSSGRLNPRHTGLSDGDRCPAEERKHAIRQYRGKAIHARSDQGKKQWREGVTCIRENWSIQRKFGGGGGKVIYPDPIRQRASLGEGGESWTNCAKTERGQTRRLQYQDVLALTESQEYNVVTLRARLESSLVSK